MTIAAITQVCAVKLTKVIDYLTILPCSTDGILWLSKAHVRLFQMRSELLKTYSIKKESLTAETFQDIINNQDLYVAGRRGLRFIKSIKPEVFE